MPPKHGPEAAVCFFIVGLCLSFSLGGGLGPSLGDMEQARFEEDQRLFELQRKMAELEALGVQEHGPIDGQKHLDGSAAWAKLARATPCEGQSWVCHNVQWFCC